MFVSLVIVWYEHMFGLKYLDNNIFFAIQKLFYIIFNTHDNLYTIITLWYYVIGTTSLV